MHNICDAEERDRMTAELYEYGIGITEGGQIYYNGSAGICLQCAALYLLRHGETLGTLQNKFMSDTSPNSCLTERGILAVRRTAAEVDRLKLNHILYSNIPRVQKTAEILQAYFLRQEKGEEYEGCFMELPWMTGIDNAGWEEKGSQELTGEDAEDFYQREILHNVFAHSSQGCCWAQVLLRCGRLVEYLNEHFQGKRVLLISQGSILMGLQMILHLISPWESYDPEEFFGLNHRGMRNYGKLQKIFGQ